MRAPYTEVRPKGGVWAEKEIGEKLQIITNSFKVILHAAFKVFTIHGLHELFLRLPLCALCIWGTYEKL